MLLQEKSLRESNEQRHATSISQVVGLRDKEDTLRHELNKLTEQLRREEEKSQRYLEQVRGFSRWLGGGLEGWLVGGDGWRYLCCEFQWCRCSISRGGMFTGCCCLGLMACALAPVP